MNSFCLSGLNIIRVSGVDGQQIELPHPDYDERRYRLYHGKKINKGEIGCYFSHMKALRMFLESDAERALICEDDITAKPELRETLEEAAIYREHWDLLRVNSLHAPTHVPIKKLKNGKLVIPVYWTGGTGAYLVNRKAAERIVTLLLPMYLPYDHALDQVWKLGITAMMIHPFPIALNEFSQQTMIAASHSYKLPFVRRYILSPMLLYRGLNTCKRWLWQFSTVIKCLFFPIKSFDERRVDT
jgi:glycosyl transferase family 25